MLCLNLFPAEAGRGYVIYEWNHFDGIHRVLRNSNENDSCRFGLADQSVEAGIYLEKGDDPAGFENASRWRNLIAIGYETGKSDVYNFVFEEGDKSSYEKREIVNYRKASLTLDFLKKFNNEIFYSLSSDVYGYNDYFYFFGTNGKLKIPTKGGEFGISYEFNNKYLNGGFYSQIFRKNNSTITFKLNYNERTGIDFTRKIGNRAYTTFAEVWIHPFFEINSFVPKIVNILPEASLMLGAIYDRDDFIFACEIGSGYHSVMKFRARMGIRLFKMIVGEFSYQFNFYGDAAFGRGYGYDLENRGFSAKVGVTF